MNTPFLVAQAAPGGLNLVTLVLGGIVFIAGLVAMINPNLDARYPVLLSINASGVGHVAVADGYGYDARVLPRKIHFARSPSRTRVEEGSLTSPSRLIQPSRVTTTVASSCTTYASAS